MSLPIGTIVPYGGALNDASIAALANQGWLFCNGESYSTQQYAGLYLIIGNAFGGTSTNFNVPDLRGLFMRGVDMGAGNDPDTSSRTAAAPGGNTGDAVGSYQADEFASHSHSYTVFPYNSGGIASGSYWEQGPGETGAAGGNETRPKNVYVNYIINAFDNESMQK